MCGAQGIQLRLTKGGVIKGTIRTDDLTGLRGLFWNIVKDTEEGGGGGGLHGHAKFKKADLRPGSYKLTVWSSGLDKIIFERRGLVIDSGNEIDLGEMTVTRGVKERAISVQVVDENDDPIPEVQVTLQNVVYYQLTDKNGQCEIISQGSDSTIVALKRGFLSARVPVDSDKTKVVLRAAKKIRLVATNPEALPPAPWRIMPLLIAKQEPWSVGKSTPAFNSEGVAEIEARAIGSLTLILMAEALGASTSVSMENDAVVVSESQGVQTIKITLDAQAIKKAIK